MSSLKSSPWRGTRSPQQYITCAHACRGQRQKKIENFMIWSRGKYILLFLDYFEFHTDTNPEAINQNYTACNSLQYISFVCLFVQLVLFCVTICMTRCQKCTRLALTTSRICQIITSKFCTMHQISNHHGEV